MVLELPKPICALPSSTPRTLAMPAPGVCGDLQAGDRLLPHALQRAAERHPDAALRAGHEGHLLRCGRGGETAGDGAATESFEVSFPSSSDGDSCDSSNRLLRSATRTIIVWCSRQPATPQAASAFCGVQPQRGSNNGTIQAPSAGGGDVDGVFRSRAEWALAQAQTEQTLPEVRVQGQDTLPHRHHRSATRTETPLRDIPQFINTVPQALIRSQNATTLQDALRNVPGISYAAAEGGTQANQVLLPARLPGQPGHLHRRRARPGRVQPRPLRHRVGRGAEGPVGAHVRPRLDRRPHQPDQQDRRPAAAQGGRRSRSAPSTRSALTADLNVRTGDSSALRLVALAEDSGYYRYPQDVEKVGLRAERALRHRQRHRHHALVLLPEDEGRHRLRPADALRPRTGTGTASACRRSRRGTTTATPTTTTRTTRPTSPPRKIDHRFNDDAEPAQHAALARTTSARWRRRSRRIAATDANGAPVTRGDAARAACW